MMIPASDFHNLSYNPHNMNVLLVDDDPTFITLHKRLLERTGMDMEISSASNGQEAMSLINDYFTGVRDLPNLVLLDLDMPTMDGFSFLEAFNRIPFGKFHNPKVVILTSSSHPKDIEKVKSKGVYTYLTKPLTEETLRKLLS
jgi:CheY-like chemotaxis protein